MRGWVLVVTLVGGCVGSSARLCDDGRTCGPDLQCDLAHHLCVMEEALTACTDKLDGNECSFVGREGVCDMSVCLEQVCGDGVKLGLEECDGAALGLDMMGGQVTCSDLGYYETGPVACSPGCTYDVSECRRKCGDGVKDPEEQCDTTIDAEHDSCDEVGFYRAGMVTCSRSCVPDFAACADKGYCGDGVIDTGEDCEPGVSLPVATCLDFSFDAGRMGCTALCTPDVAACQYIGWKRVVPPSQDVFSDIVVGATSMFVAAQQGLAIITGKTVDRPLPQAMLSGLWGSATDLWTVGGGGFVGHFDGTTHSIVSASSGNSADDLNAVWAQSPTNVFAAGNGRVLRNTTVGWSPTVYAQAGWTFMDVWGTSNGSDVFAVRTDNTSANPPSIDHFNGSWTSSTSTPALPSYASLNSVFGFGPSSVYAVGYPSVIIHNSGSGWQTEVLNPSEQIALTAVWGRAANDLWVVGHDGVGWYNDGSWWKVGTGVSTPLFALGGNATDTFATSSAGGVFKDSHAAWARNITYSTSARIMAVWTSDANRHYVLTRNDLQTKVGLGFTQARSGTANTVLAMWQSGNAVAFVQSDGHVQRDPGTGWIDDTVTTSQLYAICGSGPNDLSVGGQNGEIRHFNGSWSLEVTPTSGRISSMWSVGAGDCFAVGNDGSFNPMIRRRTSNGTWTTHTAPAGIATLRSVWGSGPSDVFAVGDVGTIIHWNGTSWSKMVAPTGLDLKAVSGSGPTDVWAVGGTGTIIRYDGVAWSSVRVPSDLETQTLESISVRPGLVLVSAPASNELFGLVRTGTW